MVLVLVLAAVVDGVAVVNVDELEVIEVLKVSVIVDCIRLDDVVLDCVKVDLVVDDDALSPPPPPPPPYTP